MERTRQDTASAERKRVRQNGEAIESLRKKDGWSQTGFARQLGLTQANLSKIERERSNARVETLNRIARLLRVPVGAIMRDPVTGEVLDLAADDRLAAQRHEMAEQGAAARGAA